MSARSCYQPVGGDTKNISRLERYWKGAASINSRHVSNPPPLFASYNTALPVLNFYSRKSRQGRLMSLNPIPPRPTRWRPAFPSRVPPRLPGGFSRDNLGTAIFLTLLGLGLISIGWMWGGIQQYRLMTYQRTTATILNSHVQENKGHRSTLWEPAITYQYVVGQNKYESQRVKASGDSQGEFDWAQKIVNEHTAGNISTAWYNPANPASAFLIRDVSGFPFAIALIPAQFLMIGVYAIAVRIEMGRKSKPPTLDLSRWYRLTEERRLDLAHPPRRHRRFFLVWLRHRTGGGLFVSSGRFGFPGGFLLRLHFDHARRSVFDSALGQLAISPAIWRARVACFAARVPRRRQLPSAPSDGSRPSGTYRQAVAGNHVHSGNIHSQSKRRGCFCSD